MNNYIEDFIKDFHDFLNKSSDAELGSKQNFKMLKRFSKILSKN